MKLRRRRSTTRRTFFALLALSFTAACGPDSDGTTPTGPQDPSPPTLPTLHDLDMSTMVVERGVGTVKVLVEARGPSVPDLEQIRFPLVTSIDLLHPDPDRPPRWWFELAGEGVEWAILRDDGVGGDEVAGDGVFSSPAYRPVTPDPRPVGSRYSWGLDTLVWVFPDTTLSTRFTGDDRLYFHVFDAELDRLPPVEVRDLAPGVQRTDHVVAIAVPRTDDVTNPAPSYEQEVLDSWYGLVGWEPDFLAMYRWPARTLLGPGAYFAIVNNETEGIGREIFSRTEELNVPPSLQGLLVMRSPPGPDGQSILIHEINHRWATYLAPELGLTDPAAHWEALDREHTFGPVYNDLELYLMGLLPADSVIPARVGTNGVTIDDIVERHGPRLPAWPDAPSTFTMGVVMVHTRPLNEDELRYADFLVREFAEGSHPDRSQAAATFVEATGGRGQIIMRIPDGPASR